MPLQKGATIETTEPLLRVPADHGLAAGTHKFQLVVVDDTGTESDPDIEAIDVRQAPTAVLDIPERVLVGKAFALSAKRSTSARPLKTFRWTLVE